MTMCRATCGVRATSIFGSSRLGSSLSWARTAVGWRVSIRHRKWPGSVLARSWRLHRPSSSIAEWVMVSLDSQDGGFAAFALERLAWHEMVDGEVPAGVGELVEGSPVAAGGRLTQHGGIN